MYAGKCTRAVSAERMSRTTSLWGILNAIVLKADHGGVESINGRIQLVKARSRGFRNKQRFRNAIYFHLGDLDLYPEAVKVAVQA